MSKQLLWRQPSFIRRCQYQKYQQIVVVHAADCPDLPQRTHDNLRLAQQHVAPDLAQPVEIHPALQMVDLVLHAGRPEPDEIALLGLAFGIHEPHRYRARALHLRRDTRQVRAGFLMGAQLDAGMKDLGIGHAHRLPAPVTGIHDRKALHRPDLRRRQPDARKRAHAQPGGVPVSRVSIRHGQQHSSGERRACLRHGFYALCGCEQPVHSTKG